MTLWSFARAYFSDPGYVSRNLKYEKPNILQNLLERQLINNPVKKQSLKNSMKLQKKNRKELVKTFIKEENKFDDLEENKGKYTNLPIEDRCSLNKLNSSNLKEANVIFASEENPEYFKRSLSEGDSSEKDDNALEFYDKSPFKAHSSNGEKEVEKEECNEENEYHFCTECQNLRPPRAVHCKLCNRCIERRDHHCSWIGNCIGQKNHKYLILLMFYSSLLTGYEFI